MPGPISQPYEAPSAEPQDPRDLAGTDAAGLITDKGYLYCMPCAIYLEVVGEPVYANPHDSELCDHCGSRVDAT